MTDRIWEIAFARLGSTGQAFTAPRIGVGRVIKMLDEPTHPQHQHTTRRLGPAMLETCECLRRHGPVRLAVLASILGARRSTVAKRVKVLEALGLVEPTDDGWRARYR